MIGCWSRMAVALRIGMLSFGLAVASFNVSADIYIGDMSKISNDDLLSHFYIGAPKENGEIRITVFGVAPNYLNVGEEYRRSLEGFNQLHGGGIKHNIKVVTATDVINVFDLEDSVDQWALDSGITEAESKKLFNRLLLRLETQLIEDVDVLFFDVREFWNSSQGDRTSVNANDVDYVIERGRWRAKFKDELDAAWVGYATKDENFITSLEYQIIADDVRYSSKTILSYAGVSLAADDQAAILDTGYNLRNREWGTRALSLELNLLMDFHARRVINDSGCLHK